MENIRHPQSRAIKQDTEHKQKTKQVPTLVLKAKLRNSVHRTFNAPEPPGDLGKDEIDELQASGDAF